MNLVDSSGWLEYFTNGPNAHFFTPPIENSSNLIIPAICIYEVFKIILHRRDEDTALQAIAHMEEGEIIDMTSSIAVSAAKLSHDLKFPMADSIILATAKAYNATIWTQDADFKDLPQVQYKAKL